jgi:hypothetical protein
MHEHELVSDMTRLLLWVAHIRTTDQGEANADQRIKGNDQTQYYSAMYQGMIADWRYVHNSLSMGKGIVHRSWACEPRPSRAVELLGCLLGAASERRWATSRS